MTRLTVVDVRCDMCQYGGPLARPEDFTTRAGFDLCRWCANQTHVRLVECGQHVVTVVDGDSPRGSWTCTCGKTSDRDLTHLLAGQGLRMAVPNFTSRTACMHSETWA